MASISAIPNSPISLTRLLLSRVRIQSNQVNKTLPGYPQGPGKRDITSLLILLLITHEHPDHLDLKAVEAVRTDKTVLILTETCAARLKGGIIKRD